MVRIFKTVLLSGTLLAASPAFAGDKPLFGPAPDWVTPPPAMSVAELAKPGVAIPLFDVQTLVDGDSSVAYVDGAIAITSPEVLNQMGNIQFTWQPAHGDLTVHRVEILRDGKVIDILGDGSRLSVLRREARLEQKIVDGSLTAFMPAEGLRVGDVLRVSHSVSITDPVIAGRAQTLMMLVAKPTTVRFGRARLVWPERQQVAWKALMPGLPAQPKAIAGGRKELVIDLPVAKSPDLPDKIPLRFRPVPVIEASSFAGWEDVSRVMAPLYRTEGAIAEGSELARITDGIAAAGTDPLVRMSEALKVVQGDVRYQLMALGTGNYEPQKPAETWEKRYGDCKAKTLLLLAMLHRLGIKAEPVMASSQMGDMVPARLPAPLAFDHVFVRAEVAGESFWLDGTSIGARLADIRDVPRFGWVLPVREKGAALIDLPVRANARPAMDVEMAYDASASIHLPMPYVLTVRYSGPQAESLRTAEVEGGEALIQLAENNARTIAGNTLITRPVSSYNAQDGSWTLRMEGVGGPEFNFRDGQWRARLNPMFKLDFNPDRSKASWRNIPALADNSGTSHIRWSIRMPDHARDFQLERAEPVKVAIPAFGYDRSITRQGMAVIDEELAREPGAEVPPAEIGATRKLASDAAGRVAEIVLPADYPQRWDDIELSRQSPAIARVRAIMTERIADKPDDAERLSDRAWLSARLLDWAGAEADYTRALELDPGIERYLARGRLRSQRGDLAGALKDARAAFDLDNDNEDARNFLAGVLSDQGKSGEALALIDQQPDPAAEGGEDKIGFLAEVLSRAGQTEKLLTLLDSALEQQASSASLLNARCWFKALANVDLEHAEADCTRAIELASAPAAYYDSRAMVHFRAGRLDQARADLDAALAIEPELAATRFMRGVVAGKTGDSKTANADLAAARRLYPSVDRFFSRYGIKP